MNGDWSGSFPLIGDWRQRADLLCQRLELLLDLRADGAVVQTVKIFSFGGGPVEDIRLDASAPPSLGIADVVAEHDHRVAGHEAIRVSAF